MNFSTLILAWTEGGIYKISVGIESFTLAIFMNKGSKTLLVIFFILMAVSIALTFYRAFISKDYIIFWDDYEEMVDPEFLEASAD